MSARKPRRNARPNRTGWALVLAVIASCTSQRPLTGAAGSDAGLDAAADGPALDGPSAPDAIVERDAAADAQSAPDTAVDRQPALDGSSTPDAAVDRQPALDAPEDAAVIEPGAGDAASAVDVAIDAAMDGAAVTGPAAVLLSPPPRLVPLGGPLARALGLQFGHDVSLAVDAAGKPFVAFVAGNASDSQVRVQSWNEAQGRWDALPSLRIAPADKAFPSRPQLALDSLGRPIVVWEEVPKPYNAPFKIHAQRWSGSAWEVLPDVADSTSPSLNAVHLTS